MPAMVRAFSTEEAAREAARKLEEAGYGIQTVLTPSSVTGREEEAVSQAVKDGLLPFAATCVFQLKRGRSLVGLNVSYGKGVRAERILDGAGAIDSHMMASYSTSDPAPLSELSGLPLLSAYSSSTQLASSSYSFSSMFGLGLLSNKAAPFSSMLSWRTLSKPKPGPWRTSFGLPMLSDNAAPLSSMIMLKPLTSPKKGPWEWSLGYPLLSNNPTPLSSMLGIPTLLK